MANSQKRDNQLNLAVDVPESTRQKTLDLNVGFNTEQKTWEVIVKYTTNLNRVRDELKVDVVELMNGYGIITIPEDLLNRLSTYEEVEFIEKPKRLIFEVEQGKSVSCVTAVQSAQYNLFGEGVIVAIIDSGIDYAHPDFRNEDGTSRILYLWDQTIPGNPPASYSAGTVYTKEQIDAALAKPSMMEQMELIPSSDGTGHGTHVAGIACGNGRASNGKYRGVASKSDMIVVKLGRSIGQSFPQTTQLMEAINFVIQMAVQRDQPIAINISFGNNYGSHSGLSILENYINAMANVWKTNICIGTGNEGSTSRHTSGIVGKTEPLENDSTIVEVSVTDFEATFNLQIWKNFYDDFDVEIISPGGIRSGAINKILGTQRFNLENTEILLYYGEPIPYNRLQEIYIEFIPRRTYINGGIWKFRLIPKKIVDGTYHMWLPTGSLLNPDTKFLRPVETITLTIPSTAYRAISVGAYDSITDSYAAFSGRGFTTDVIYTKPEITAPGVEITSTAPNGGYTVKSGTSMATPFVTGAAALMMQYGIVEGNDPYMYGEKLKAYLMNGARHLPGYEVWPNPQVGYGALCLRDSLPS